MCFTGQLAAIIIDEYPKSKEWFVALLICGVGFLSSIVFVTPVKYSLYFINNQAP